MGVRVGSVPLAAETVFTATLLRGIACGNCVRSRTVNASRIHRFLMGAAVTLIRGLGTTSESRNVPTSSRSATRRSVCSVRPPRGAISGRATGVNVVATSVPSGHAALGRFVVLTNYTFPLCVHFSVGFNTNNSVIFATCRTVRLRTLARV